MKKVDPGQISKLFIKLLYDSIQNNSTDTNMIIEYTDEKKEKHKIIITLEHFLNGKRLKVEDLCLKDNQNKYFSH